MDELINLDGMDVLLRPMRADDAPLHQEFIARLKPDDLRFRFGRATSCCWVMISATVFTLTR